MKGYRNSTLSVSLEVQKVAHKLIIVVEDSRHCAHGAQRVIKVIIDRKLLV